jgi:hypothetical protein
MNKTNQSKITDAAVGILPDFDTFISYFVVQGNALISKKAFWFKIHCGNKK